jgi:hypothetical protein
MAGTYSLTIRNRAVATLVAVGILGVGAVFLTVGFALVLGLLAAGTVFGAVFAAYRAIRHGKAGLRAAPFDALGGMHRARVSGLDPALEVKSVLPPTVRPANEGGSQR